MPIGQAAQSFLTPGPLFTDCSSALVVGVVFCRRPTSDPDDGTSVNEAQVTRYLEQYGKPPREAVRALLDPSDSNIAAWIRKQRQIVSTASYVASRMTDMQSRLAAEFPPSPLLPLSQLPAMMQVRATLYLSSADAPSLRAARALQQLVAQYPSVDGRMVQVDVPADRTPSRWLAQLDTLLPASITARGHADDLPVPSLVIEDLRHGTSSHLGIEGITPQRIRDEIVALRERAEGRGGTTIPAVDRP
jgi:hypothetical protein